LCDRQVDVINLKTGTFAAPIPVGSDPLGLDITPDGKTLVVCDGGAASISEVTLNNGNALFTTTFEGSGFGGTAYDLNLSTKAINVVPGIGIEGQVTEVTPLSRSADYSTAAAVLGDDSEGPFDVYTAATGNVVAGSLNEFISSSALSGNGSTLLIDGTDVINAATGSLVGTIGGPGGNSVLNTAGTTGYTLYGSSITELNITALSTGSVINLPGLASGGAELAISPNGNWLVAEIDGGAAIVKL